MRPARRVAVVGGGISGLAVAYRLRERAASHGIPVAISVLERESWCGGKIRSVRDAGFVCETGPNGFLDSEPATLRLVDDLGLRPELLRSNDAARHRFILRGGRLRQLEMHPLRFMTSSLLSLPGRVRVASELFIPASRHAGEESVGDFGRRRLGSEFVDVMLDSMVSGIFAGDVDRLSIGAAFPKVVELERRYGGLIRGMLARSREAKRGSQVAAGPAGVLHSFRLGMGQPIDRLVAEIGPDLRTRVEVKSIVRSHESRRYTVASTDGTINADVVVIALPAPNAADALRELSGEASAALGVIPLAGVHVVCAGYERRRVTHPLAGFGALIPRSEGVRVLGTIWTSSTFSGRAAEGRVLLTTMVGGAHDPTANDLTDDELIGLVRREIDPIYGIDGEPSFVRTFRWPAGIPQYNLGHLDHVARARAALSASPGVFLTGNSIAGVSFNHCIAHSETIAEQAVDHLRSLGS